MEAIVCRSTEQIQEDNVVELHTRLTRWLSTLLNERCFGHREIERKQFNVQKLKALVSDVELAIIWGEPESVDVCTIERLGIRYMSMLR